MKKIATGASLIAAIGFSALSVAPASAVTLPFPNCDTAEAAGVYNIPASSPAYGPHLDRDKDGFGCDATSNPYNPAIVDQIVADNNVVVGKEVPGDDQQVVQVPVGPADTGVTPESTNNVGSLALGGGLALMAAAGGTYVVRRRSAQV